MMAKCTSGLGQRRQRVQADEFLSLRVPLPDISGQKRIAAWLDYLHERRREAAWHVERAATATRALHDALCRTEAAPVHVGEKLTLIRKPIHIDPEKSYRQIGIYSFGKGIIYRDPVPGSQLSKLRYFEVPADALVLSNIQAWEGAIAGSTKEDVTYIASNRFLSYVAKTADTDTNFLRYYFLSESGHPLIQRASPGTMVRNRTLGIEAFENLQVPLPSIAEQRFIAAVLDKAYEALRRIQEREKLLDALLASALNQAFTAVPRSFWEFESRFVTGVAM